MITYSAIALRTRLRLSEREIVVRTYPPFREMFRLRSTWRQKTNALRKTTLPGDSSLRSEWPKKTCPVFINPFVRCFAYAQHDDHFCLCYYYMWIKYLSSWGFAEALDQSSLSVILRLRRSAWSIASFCHPEASPKDPPEGKETFVRSTLPGDSSLRSEWL